ncbi:MAG: PAS domain-containing protein [bacterium]|nr:PAS domain-containing protein [bacterium]
MPRESYYLETELLSYFSDNPELFQFIEQASADGIWYWDLTQPEEEWMNEQFWHTLGYPPESMEHTPASWQQLVHPDDLPIVLADAKRALKDPVYKFEREVRYRHHKGYWVKMRCFGVVLKDKQGLSTRMLGGHRYLGAVPEGKGQQLPHDFLSHLLPNLPGASYKYRLYPDGSDEFSFLSPEIKAWFGIPAETEVIKHTDGIWKAIHPEDTVMLETAIQRSADQLSLFQLEWRLITPSGVKWLSTTAQPHKNQDGSVEWYVFVSDVTDRKEAEAALRTQLHMQEALRKISTQHISQPLEDADVTINQALGIIGRFVNADRVYIFDYDFRQQTTSNTYEWCAEGIEPEIDNLQDVPMSFFPDWLTAHLNNEVMHIPNVQELPQNMLREVLEPQGIKSLLAVPMYQGDRCAGFVGFDSVKNYHVYSKQEMEFLRLSAQVLVNILTYTEERVKLINSKQELQKLTQNVPGAILKLQITPEGKFSVPFLSEGARRLIPNLNIEEVQNNLEELLFHIYHEDLSAFYHNLLISSEKLSKFYMEYRVRTTEDTIRWHRIDMRPEQEANGVIAWYGIVLDVSDQKEIEQIKHQHRALKDKYNEVENFAFIASHDLKEPLRTISSFSRLLLRQYQNKLDDNAKEYLQFITDGSVRMSKLIDGLLEFSRLGRNRTQETVDCQAMVGEILSDFDTVLQESGAMIKFAGLPTIQGYTMELRQLFQNLISNAIKFRKQDQIPEVEINARRQEKAWLFEVKDNGIGIPEEHQERIFEIFSRLHSRQDYEGTGIGLANCKKIVDLHNGDIWVESTPGAGSSFFFTIPVEQ